MIALGVQIGASREAGWEDPIGLLADCHRRIERFLGVLARIVALDASAPLGEEARSALKAALHYFRTSGSLHTADEEESLFPRLRAQKAGAMMLAHQTDALESDHRHAERLHVEIEELTLTWTRMALSEEQIAALRKGVNRLASLYAAHIRIEETEVFAAARTLLTAEQIASMGAELRARREK
jgi:hemerythrin-like domain-containing protein